MGGIVNLIKKLFSGIFSFVGGLLPGSKKSGGGYYLELSDSEAGKPAPTSEAPKPAAEPKQEAAPVAAAKAEPAKVTEVAATNGSQPTATALNLPQPTITFAEAAMTPQPSNGRRRPGANMNSYLEMARGMKTAKN